MRVEIWDRYKWLMRVRPMIVGNTLLKLLAPTDRRQIVPCAPGLKLYVDPLSGLGEIVRHTGGYEPEVTEIFQRVLRPGMRFLDIGANEGLYSALAGVLCGAEGRVISVEPQNRLQDLIRINASLNGVTSLQLFNKGFGGDPGTSAEINLFPDGNTGASSVVRTYRLSRKTQSFEYVSFDTLLQASGGNAFDLVKVDVEGFEPEVAARLIPHIRKGQVRRLLLDYHAGILAERHVDPQATHKALVGAGMTVEGGDATHLSEYVLYRYVDPTS